MDAIWFVVLAVLLVGTAMLVAGLLELRRRLPALRAAYTSVRQRRGQAVRLAERTGALNLELAAVRSRLAEVSDELPVGGRHRS